MVNPYCYNLKVMDAALLQLTPGNSNLQEGTSLEEQLIQRAPLEGCFRVDRCSKTLMSNFRYILYFMDVQKTVLETHAFSSSSGSTPSSSIRYRAGFYVS